MRDEPAGPAAGGPVPGERGVAGLVPFGLDGGRPRALLDAITAGWDNRGALPYAWHILRDGACDGCGLAQRGLRDAVTGGPHLCGVRLRSLRHDTAPPFAPADVVDVEHLRELDDAALRALGRVPYPFVYRPGDRGFTRASWDDALALVGAAAARVDPDRHGWIAGGAGLSLETAYAFAKAARVLGSPHVDTSGLGGHRGALAGMEAAIGTASSTVSLSDLYDTDLALLWGVNLVDAAPATARYLARAKRRGTRIVAINPLREPLLDATWHPSDPLRGLFGDRLTDDLVQVRPGGDAALATAVLRLLVDWRAVDDAFVGAHTTGWGALRASIAHADVRDLAARAGTRINDVEWLARLVARARSLVTVFGGGPTRHPAGSDAVAALVHLHLARGAIGRVGAGLLPVGPAGAPVAALSGAAWDRLPGDVPVDEAHAGALSEAWGHAVPSAPGRSVAATLDAARDGGVDFLCTTGDPDLGDPDRVAAALARVDVRVHLLTHLHAAALAEPGALVVLLPARTRHEQPGGSTVISVDRHVRVAPEIARHAAPPEARAPHAIAAALALAARPEAAGCFGWRDAADLRAELVAVIPALKGAEAPGSDVQPVGRSLCAGGRFAGMPDEKARFTPISTRVPEVPDGWFELGGRSGDADLVYVGAHDADALGVASGDPVRLSTAAGVVVGAAHVVDLPPGHLQCGWAGLRRLLPEPWRPVGTVTVRLECLPT